jgi:NAD-dependent dihydropyrimidine dehydrogenase PreA subunit
VRPRDGPAWIRDTALRLLPHATRPGLRRIGHPGPASPVLVTGNYTLTVRRLRDALGGRDAWLVIANSRGVNVWCAAGGGHLTDHDVIGALRASRIDDVVQHRRLVLPQLAATGIERRHIVDATGWKAVWGPARLEDLPAFLDRGGRVVQRERFMRFPLWERLEMAVTWILPMALVSFGVSGWLCGPLVGGVAAGTIAAAVFTIFAALPRLRVTGSGRARTYGAFAAAQILAGGFALFATGHAAAGGLAGLGLSAVASMALLSVDLAGTTPWYPSTINSFGNHMDIELDEERCTGAADCVQVCPRNVLAMDGARRKVEITRPDDCIRCGACIVQCPSDALRFRFADGRIVDADTVRSTRLNMLGRRAVRHG